MERHFFQLSGLFDFQCQGAVEIARGRMSYSADSTLGKTLEGESDREVPSADLVGGGISRFTDVTGQRRRGSHNAAGK